MKQFINYTILRSLLLSIPLLISVGCANSVPPPEPNPEIFPEPHGEVNISPEEQEFVVTLKKDVTAGFIVVNLQTSVGDRVWPWSEFYKFSFPCCIQGRGWSVDYTESCLIKVTLNQNDTGCIRHFWIDCNTHSSRDDVLFIQAPVNLEEYPKLESGGKTEYNVKFVNNSSHTIALNNIYWGDNIHSPKEVTSLELSPSQAQIAKIGIYNDEIDLEDKRYTSLWCSAAPPIMCDVTFDCTYGLSHSYFEETCGEFCLTDWKNYEISGGRIPEEQIESGYNPLVLKWTLTYTFTDADYEYAVANGNIR